MAESHSDYESANDAIKADARRIMDSLGAESVWIVATLANSDGSTMRLSNGAGNFFASMWALRSVMIVQEAAYTKD